MKASRLKKSLVSEVITINKQCLVSESIMIKNSTRSEKASWLKKAMSGQWRHHYFKKQCLVSEGIIIKKSVWSVKASWLKTAPGHEGIIIKTDSVWSVKASRLNNVWSVKASQKSVWSVKASWLKKKKNNVWSVKASLKKRCLVSEDITIKTVLVSECITIKKTNQADLKHDAFMAPWECGRNRVRFI